MEHTQPHRRRTRARLALAGLGAWVLILTGCSQADFTDIAALDGCTDLITEDMKTSQAVNPGVVENRKALELTYTEGGAHEGLDELRKCVDANLKLPPVYSSEVTSAVGIFLESGSPIEEGANLPWTKREVSDSLELWYSPASGDTFKVMYLTP